MKKRLLLLALLALLPLAVLGSLWFMARSSQQGGEVGLNAEGTALRSCPETPNCVCSQDAGSDAAIEPLAFSGDADVTLASLIEFLQTEEHARVVTVEGNYVHAVYWTRLFKFVDDVEFLVAPDVGVVHVRSASRVGHSDMGANRDRVESIRARWLPPAATGSELHDNPEPTHER